jgi:hypothetical protein
MFRKSALIAILILGLIGGLFFLYRHIWFASEVRNPTNEESPQVLDRDTATTSHLPETPTPSSSRVHLHPLADPVKLAEAKQQSVETWDEWLDATVEVLLAEAILYGRVKAPTLSMSWIEDTPEGVAENRAWLREVLTRHTKHHKAWLKLPPAYPGGLASVSELGKYHGPYPPTSESLIAEFDAVFMDRYPKLASLDEYYPKDKWLGTLLEKGAHFTDYSDYSYYLKLRRSVLQRKDKPDEWRSGAYGIPITTNFEEYADSFLDRKVWEYSIVQKVRAENPDTSPTVYFPAEHPDKYLPAVGEVTYVNLGENRESMSTSGTLLTGEQWENLQKYGIEPEGIEIVYLDDDYNLLATPPPLVDERTFALQGVTEFDGVKVTPENYESLMGVPIPPEWLENYERREAEVTSTAPTDANEAIRTAARNAMQAEQARFQQGLQELERFVNMSDAEFQAELDQRFTPQLPELLTAERLEKQLWSEAQSALMTPGRFEAALKILEQYGPEEGMRKLTKADPKAAAQVKRIFGDASAPEQPPKPPTRPKQQGGTAPPEQNGP